MNHAQDRKNRREELLKSARTIAETAKAEGRDLNRAEAAEVENALTEVKSINDWFTGLEKSRDIFAQLDSQATGAGMAHGERLTFGKGLADRIVHKMIGDSGAKALATSGTILAGAEFYPDPIALGKPANGLLSILPVVRHDRPQYQVLVQTARDNKAAEVADHAVKPTSVYSLQMVAQNLKIIAHITEAIPRYWLSDAPAVQQWVTSELVWGLQQSVESNVFAGIAATSGIQSVAYSVSPIQSLRKAIEVLEVQGHKASAFLISHSDWTAIELACTATTGALEYQSIPLDSATRRLFGVPVVPTQWAAAGGAYVISEGSVALDTDTDGVQVQWSENATADSFAKNEVIGRAELRANVSVYQPLGVAKVALK